MDKILWAALWVGVISALFTMIAFDLLWWTHRRKARTLQRNR